jgi:hypothetical protein
VVPKDRVRVFEMHVQCEVDQPQSGLATESHVATRRHELQVRFDVAVVRGRHDAPSADSHVHEILQRRQEICKAGLSHPITQVQDLAAPNEQRVSLLEGGDPAVSLDAGERSEFQQFQRFPPQPPLGSPSMLPLHHRIRVDPTGHEQRARLGDRPTQEVAERVVNARVGDSIRSKSFMTSPGGRD